MKKHLFKIATWNVNSLRVRLPDLLQWLASAQPDVVALQETKLEDKNFPLVEIRQAGYDVVYSGQKTYNGVALLSKKYAIDEVEATIPDLNDEQRRLLIATIHGVRVINLYVPNGSSVDSDKYVYKLDWLAKVKNYIKQQTNKYQRVVVLGDFNIAPDDRDVHDPKQWEGQVLVSEPERLALREIIELGLQDTFRLFTPEGGFYTWWDYRAGAFRRNHGLRIDHILASQPLAVSCVECIIDRSPRENERPSDHTPIIASFSLE